MSKPSLKARFAALQSERERSWSAEQLASNGEARDTLIRRYDPARHAQAGDVVAPFTLTGRDGATLTSADLLADGPAVILVFRFGSCAACNIALPYYDETLRPVLDAAGIPLIAVSPQTPVDGAFIDRHDLAIPVYTDPDYRLARALGITFLPDEQPAVAAGQDWIGATLGTNSYELPQPTVLILERDGRIRDIIVSPDWLDRPETGTILTRLGDIPRIEAA